MSEPITVTVTSLSPDTVKVDGSSSQTVQILNGGAVNVAVGTVSPGNATIVSGTLAINSTTTLAAGQAAYVKNDAGTAYAAKLDIGIPAGPATLVSVGNTTTLAAGSNATVTGATDGSNLTLSFGIPAGANGITPAFAIGNVTTGAAGSSASVVATTSNSGANVTLDLTIPRGDPGTSGSNGTNGTSLTLSDATPSALGTASAGTSSTVSRADHTHQLPVIAYANLSNVPSNFPTNTTLVSGLNTSYATISHAHNYVTALNNLTGSLTLVPGSSNVTVTANGSTLTIDSSAGGLGANDVVDGGDYIGEILLGITFGTQPQSQTVSSSTTANLSAVTVSQNAPSSQVSAAGSYLLASTANVTLGSQSYDATLTTVISSDNGSTWSTAGGTGMVGGTGDPLYLQEVRGSAASNGTRTVFASNIWQYSDSPTLSSWTAIGGDLDYSYSLGGVVAWNGSRFIALVSTGLQGISQSGYPPFYFIYAPYSSSDGASWTARTASGAYAPGQNRIFTKTTPRLLLLGGSCYTFGIAGGSYATPTAPVWWSTSDGISWTTSFWSGDLPKDAASSGSRIVTVNGTQVRYSANGMTWSTATLPVPCDRITFAKGLFWATNSTSNGTDVCYSADGISWTLGTLPASTRWIGAAATSSANSVFFSGTSANFARATLNVVPASANLTVSATAASGNPVSYQWQNSLDAGTSWGNVSNATTSALNLTGLTGADNGTRYRALASATGATPATSQSATLTVTG